MFSEKTEPDANGTPIVKQAAEPTQMTEITWAVESMEKPEAPQPNETQVPTVEEDILAGIDRLSEEEKGLLMEKQRLLAILEELQHSLSAAFERKKLSIDNLKVEVLELQKKCEEVAKVLEISIYTP
jgi:hypothetical protein